MDSATGYSMEFIDNSGIRQEIDYLFKADDTTQTIYEKVSEIIGIDYTSFTLQLHGIDLPKDGTKNIDDDSLNFSGGGIDSSSNSLRLIASPIQITFIDPFSGSYRTTLFIDEFHSDTTTNSIYQKVTEMTGIPCEDYKLSVGAWHGGGKDLANDDTLISDKGLDFKKNSEMNFVKLIGIKYCEGINVLFIDPRVRRDPYGEVVAIKFVFQFKVDDTARTLYDKMTSITGITFESFRLQLHGENLQIDDTPLRDLGFVSGELIGDEHGPKNVINFPFGL